MKHAQNTVVYNPFPNFDFTGKLRPVYPLTPTRKVPSHIPRPDYAQDGIPRSENAQRGQHKVDVLSAEDQKAMRKVCGMAREILDLAVQAAKPGVTTDEIDRVVHAATIERDAYPSPLNYNNFPKSVCTSVNEVICHGIPDGYELQDGDILNIDVTAYYDGFHGDLNETIFIGTPAENAKKIVQVSYECLMKAIEVVQPGTLYRDIGNVIQRHATASKAGVVRSYCGHGIHRLFHTAPNIPHYAKNKTPGVMKAGHCFTIEPMITEGSYYDDTWPDNWTAVTADGKLTAQFEHTMLVTEKGVDILTNWKDGKPYFMHQLEAMGNVS